MTDSSAKRRWPYLAAAAAYPLLLGLLTLAERRAPDASIRTFSDAFWYSLVTMSTVGYGDVYPVTLPGRLVGVVFILLSLGVLAFLMGLVIRVFAGRMLPGLRLWMARKKTWYIFSCQNSAAFALAGDLTAQDPDCIVLFPRCADSAPPAQLRCLIYSGSIEAVAAKKKDRCSICFLDEENPYGRAVAALQTGHRVYCRTDYAPDECRENLTLFNPYDCCAQRYWQDHGLKSRERTVILIGDGRYAQELLTRGLLLNVFAPDRKITYHLFGSWDNYLRNHHQLATTLCLNGEDPAMDCLHFHRSAWNGAPELLAAAHRIILCQDAPDANVEILGQLHRYFPVTGEIHLLHHSPFPGQIVFGTDDTTYTAQLVLQEQLTKAARTMHRIYCDSAGGSAPAWENLSEFLRQSNIAAAGHLLTKIRLLLNDDTICAITPENCRAAYARYCGCSPEQQEICRRIEHQRWMRFHSIYNWRYAPQRNNSAREHPLMLPYDALSPSEQCKDDYAWELLAQLADRLDT